MTGRSFLDVLFSGKGGRVDAARNRVFFGKEFHNPDEIFPMRGVRTDEFLYIHNFNPDVPKRWTLGGAPPVLDAESPDFGPKVSAYPDLYIIARRNDPEIAKLYDMAYGPRPREELYDVKHDRWQLNNLAEDPAYAEVKAGLKQKLFEYLGKTGDPRIGDDPDIFHRYFEKYAPKTIK
jgi:arylsulfatase A-like enzyme